MHFLFGIKIKCTVEHYLLDINTQLILSKSNGS